MYTQIDKIRGEKRHITKNTTELESLKIIMNSYITTNLIA